MKKYILFIGILLIIIFDNSTAQNFFPIKVGNIYQIKYDWSWSGPGGTGESGTEFETISVTNDSVINEKSFYLIEGEPFLPEYLFRYDSSNQKLLVKIPGDDSIRLAVDFNAPEDSTYISYLRGVPSEFTSAGITPEVFWGDTLQMYKMTSTTGTYDIYNFTENVGFSYFSKSGGGGSLWYSDKYSTVSAIIDSNIFHPLTLQIDSLFPVIDRPINTFPFIMNIPFHASYYQLINIFQLSLEIERDSEIVLNSNYNISISNPHIQLNPSDLQTGDLIKLKALLTDSSIFNNIDTYPDSGWITFRVLDPVSVRDSNPVNLKYELEPNYPNPFNPVTVITYEIPECVYVSVKIYDILGNEIADLVNDEMPPGIYNVEFNAEKLSSGVYICRFKTADFTKSTKMILTK